MLGAGLLVWSIQGLDIYRRSSGWPTVEGIVIQSGLDEQGFRALYEYEVGGSVYYSDRISLLEGSTNAALDADELAARYPEGIQVDVYYDPYDPEMAMLRRGSATPLYVALVTGVFVMLLAVAGVIAGTWDALERRSGRRRSLNRQRSTASDDVDAREQDLNRLIETPRTEDPKRN